jgi:hypothetical protein
MSWILKGLDAGWHGTLEKNKEYRGEKLVEHIVSL